MNTNSKQTNDAKRAITGNVAMQVGLHGGQICNQCMWLYLVAKFIGNARGATWWLNLEPMQVVQPGDQI